MKKKHKKEQGILKITTKLSDLSEEEKERALFNIFDRLLSASPKENIIHGGTEKQKYENKS